MEKAPQAWSEIDFDEIWLVQEASRARDVLGGLGVISVGDATWLQCASAGIEGPRRKASAIA
jgi:hypothetical protein